MKRGIISAAGVALLDTPCPTCGAASGVFCRGTAHVDRQHKARYQRWKDAGLPVAPAERVMS